VSSNLSTNLKWRLNHLSCVWQTKESNNTVVLCNYNWFTTVLITYCPMWAWGNPPYSFTSPPSTLSYSILLSPFPFLTLFVYFLAFPSLPIFSRIVRALTMRAIVTGLPPPPSGFCHPMRLSDFIDFISFEHGREDSCSRWRIPLSQLKASDRGGIVYCSACQRRGGCNHINLQIRESAN